MEESSPLVSIIVRTKDRPKLLKKALQSIAAQTYRPIEVILVNDGGCDLDIEELKGILGDVSLNYIRLEKNTGRAHAGNVGIENATGEYVGFLDDDDEFYPEHIETLAAFLITHAYSIAYTDTEMVSRSYSSEDKKMVDAVTAVFSRDFVYYELLINNYIPFNSLLFSTEVLTRKGCIDESFTLYEDWDLLIRLAQDHQFFHIAKTTARYYQWSDQLQVNQSDAAYMHASHLKVIGKHLHQFTPQVMYHMKQQRDTLALQLDNLRKEERGGSQHIARMEALIREKDNLLARRDKLLVGLEETVRKQEVIMGEKDEHIVRLVHDLEVIKNTRGWRLLEGIRRAKEVILYPLSERGQAFRLVSKSLQVLRRDGLAAFLKKAKRKAMKPAALGIPTPPAASLPLTDEFCREHFPSPRAFRVLFVKWEWAGITNHYRVDNMAEYVRINGTYAEILDLEDLPQNIPHAYEFDLVIIHRIPMHPILGEFIEACRKRKIILIFDIDDYLFESSVVREIEWVKHTSLAERERLIEHMMQCRQTLDACDYFITTTDFLAKKAEELGKRAFVLRNGFSIDLYRSFLRELEIKTCGENDGIFRIGYFSGTNTHQKDFQFISPAILQILREYDNVNLYICGLLDLDSSFEPFSHRVERGPLVPLEKLPEEMARCDINLAPLEPANVFCEGKSELKYIYAGVMKIPTVASPSDAFRRTIKHGENGFLASTAEEWYQCLKALVEKSSLRMEMGKQAYNHVVNSYAPEALARAVQEVYGKVIADRRERNNVPEQSISVGIIVSDLIDNIDAYHYFFEIADILAVNGHRVTFYFYGGNNGHPAEAPRSACEKLGHVIVRGGVDIISTDVLICTDPFNSSVTVYKRRDRAACLAYLPGPKNYLDIPYPWAKLFHVIPYSPNVGDSVSQLENIIWEPAASRKS